MPSHSTESLRDGVDLRRLPWIRSLAADYARRAPALNPFFAGHPSQPRDWQAAIARAQSHPRDRAALAAVLAAQQERRRAPAAAVEAARRLADPASVAVVTGQQAGLFGGPLFTLLKALTALKLAEQVSRDHGAPALAVFWVDAEDHDWDEVRACTVLDDQLQTQTVSLPERSTGARPVAAERLGEGIGDVINRLETHLPATEFTNTWLDRLRQCYVPGRGMAEAFSVWLEHLLGPRGLVVYDASDPAAKPLAAPVFARELLTAGVTARLAGAAGEQLAQAGYHAQVQLASDAVALFSLNDERVPFRRDGDGFVAGSERYPRSQVADWTTTDPSRFSPNVLLRPVVQDALFPTVCYVAGPNELAYLAQLREVYAHFGVPMPLVYPRATATLLDAAALRFLHKYDVALETLMPQDESGLNTLLKAQIPAAVEAAFTDAEGAIARELTALAGAVPAIDPTLAGAANTTLARMQTDLRTLHNKVIQAAKRRDETLRRQFLRTRALAFPNGHPQEREVGFLWFLNQYGPALVERLADDLPLEMEHHWVMAV